MMIQPQTYKPPRPERDLCLLIESQRKIVADLLDLATDFYAVDFRPLIHDGVSVQHIGPDPLPMNLKMFIEQEQLALAELQHELYRRRLIEEKR